FDFWDSKLIYKAIKQTLDAEQWQELCESLGATLPSFCHWLGERALENFTSALGVFINEDGQTHLRMDGSRFVLFASRDFFSNVSASADPQRRLLKNISPSNYELLSDALNALTAASQDPFVQQLGQRWGAQSELHEESQAKPAAAKKAKKRASKRGHAKKTQAGFKEPWREAKELFNIEYSEGYDEFKRKIAGFDLQEEANHNADKPLVGRQQAVEAFGSLLGDTLNFTSHKLAEKYDLNLNPKTNPGKDGFWAWMDNSTDWLAKAFYQAADSFDTEKQTIELEIEAKSSEELQKLDQELAELARKIAQKDGQLDADTQALVDKLTQAAKKVIDIHDPNLPPAERKRLVREIRKKNAQAGSRMEFIQQQNKYRFAHLYEFADGPIQTIPDPDLAQSSKVTSSDFAANRLPAPTEEEFATLAQPETNFKTGQRGPLSRAPSFFEVLGQNAAHWQQNNQQHQTDKPLAAASLRPLSELEKQTGGYGAPMPFATQNQIRQAVLQTKLPLHEASKEVTRD
ncbi:MAG: hypothetical protein ACRC1U_00435, partial [Vibrionaceae bacterium]